MELVEVRPHPPQDKRRATVQCRILQPSVGHAANEPRLPRRRPGPKQVAVDEDPPGKTAAQHPVFELHFDRDGKVRKVELIQDSGAPAIDDRLMDCLYRWRAKGDRLKTLKPDDRLKLKMRLLVR